MEEVCDELHAFEAKTLHASEQILIYIRKMYELTKQNIMDTL